MNLYGVMTFSDLFYANVATRQGGFGCLENESTRPYTLMNIGRSLKVFL